LQAHAARPARARALPGAHGGDHPGHSVALMVASDSLMILPGLHVALIMDGNGRWAARRGMPRAAGHRAGVRSVRQVIEAAPGLGIGTLTLYAFSSDTWRRPPEEVGHLMGLLHHYLQAESRRCVTNGVRVTALGRRDRLPKPVQDAFAAIETATASCRRLHLRIAV